MKRASKTLLALAAALVAACAAYQPFDTVAHLRQDFAKRMGPEAAAAVVVPFELDEAIRAELAAKLKPLPNERRKITQLLDYIFTSLDLHYSLVPTRSAVETFRTHEGNCLSFVNLFVGLARHQGMNPFYVEVTDYQRWNRRGGMVVSQGHIVAGMYLDGELKTYDFLPYRPKAYKDFKPIDDVTAAAHYYNNLGAESLLAGDNEGAGPLLTIATEIAPTFDKALNNLGVYHARHGRFDLALELYQRGMAAAPENTMILTNMARAYQEQGRSAEAAELLARVESANTTNPFFFLYEADLALSRGESDKALEYLTRALRQDSEVPEVHIGFVKLYMAIGEMDKARHHLSRALKLDATNEEARHFAQILSK